MSGPNKIPAAHTADDASDLQRRRPHLIVIPDASHRILRWKVRPGSAVRMGETVAFAAKKNTEDMGNDFRQLPWDNQPSSTAHKRPTKRRKPGPAAPEENGESQTTFQSTTRGHDSEGLNVSNPAANPPPVKQLSHKMESIPLTAGKDGILRIGNLAGDEKSTLIVGYVETCSHPTVVAGLCAVCGKVVEARTATEVGGDPAGDTARGSDTVGASTMSQMTVSGGITVTVSEQEGQLIAKQDAERLRKIKKLSLVLDLDHTLVHAVASWDDRARAHFQHAEVRSLLLPVPVMEGNVQRELRMQHFVKLRPHVKEFLSKLQECYEIGVYTAGTRRYANEVTILLARHLVGASHDQYDLEQLRHKIFLTENELKKMSLIKEQSNGERGHLDEDLVVASNEMATNATERLHTLSAQNGECSLKHSPDIAGSSEPSNDTDAATNNSDVITSNRADVDKSEEPKPTRKRVAFGEPPPSQKTDSASEQDLEELKRELINAERLEAQALEMRMRIFGSRVVSRSDVGDLGRDVKSLKRIFPCGGTMAAVVDDREDVWANAQEQASSQRRGEPPDNLLLVRPYHWDKFLGLADVNNASGDVLPASADGSGAKDQVQDSELDQQLLWTTDILLRLHKRYYANGNNQHGHRRTVPEILSSMRREVLHGCNIVLSGLIPLHKQQSTAFSDQPRPALVRYVENLGGIVCPVVTKEITHVVGGKDGTDKILAARKVPGCIVVKPLWLMECVWSLTRRNELDHLLGSAPRLTTTSAALRPLADSKRDSSSTSSSDEDDDLVAELESEFL